MKRFLLAVALLFSPAAFAQDPPRVTFTASNVMDSGGSAVLASGKLCFVTTDAKDKPMGYRVGSGSGQTSASPDQAPCAVVTAGAISPIQIINSAASSPQNACIRVVTKDANGIEIRRSPCVQTGTADALTSWCSASGGVVTCNWDQYPVGTIPIPLVQQGSKGDKGDKGDSGTNGTDGCVVGDGSCDTVVSLNPSTDQNIVQPDVTALKINGSPVLTPANGGLVSAPASTQSVSQPLNIPQVFPYKSLIYGGDSTVGDMAGHCYGASSAAMCPWYKLGTALGVPQSAWTITGIGGSDYAQQAANVFAQVITANGYQLIGHATGINDCNQLGCPTSNTDGNKANAPAMFTRGLTAEAVWYLTPESMKVRGKDACTGNGFSVDSNSYGVGAIATTQNSQCTATVSATTVVDVGYMNEVGNGGTFTVDVDGGSGSGGSTVTVASQVAVDNIGDPIIPGGNDGLVFNTSPQVVQVPVTFTGPHSVKVTVTSSPTITFTGNTTAGSTYITGVTDTRWVTGQSISGAGIPSSTTIFQTIQAPVPTGSVPLSVPATATATGVTFTVSGASARILYFSGDAQPQSTGAPVLMLGGMPSNGLPPFTAAGQGYEDQPSDNYNKAIRGVCATLRSQGRDCRFVDERATQTATTKTFTATTTSGSNVITVSSTDGISVGDALFAMDAIPAQADGARVTAIGSGTITIAYSSNGVIGAPATATASGTYSSGVSHWFNGSKDGIHPSDFGYEAIAQANIHAASGLTDNTLRSAALPVAAATCTQFPCLAAEYHSQGLIAALGQTELLRPTTTAVYRYCAAVTATALSSTNFYVYPAVTYTTKYVSLPINAGLAPMNLNTNLVGDQSTRNTYIPFTMYGLNSALYYQSQSGGVTIGDFNQGGPVCTVFTTNGGQPIYVNTVTSGTNTGGNYAIDATLEQLTKQ